MMCSFPFQYLQLPKKDDVNVNFRSYWNSGVFYTFDFIANIPSKVGNLKDYIVDFASSPVDKKENEAPAATNTEEVTPVSSLAAEAPAAAAEASSQEKPPAEETK